MSCKTLEVNYVENLPIDIIKGETYTIMQSNPNTYTHSYFKYPCKFIPEIPSWAIKKYLEDSSKLVYDPFSGSGTTLLEGIILGHNCYGTEIDGLAKLLIKVKTTPLTFSQIKEAKKIICEITDIKILNNYTPIIAEINNLYHWFPEENILILGRMRGFIESLSKPDVKDFFKICFASIIKKCSFADDISPKPYVSSKIKKIPKSPIIELKKIFDRYIVLMEKLSEIKVVKKAKIIEGDALRTSFSGKVDLIVTSPPYINAFDYARTLRLENIWLGNITEKVLLDKKKYYVGTEKIITKDEERDLEILKDSELLKCYYKKIIEVDKKRGLILKKFFNDMKLNLLEMKKILKNESMYVIVIGNNSIRKINIESWKVLKEIAIKVGYEVETYFDYIIQNSYIRIPRNGKGGKINKDHVLVLRNKDENYGSKK